jgi:uncharacterized protein (DUF2267 family)
MNDISLERYYRHIQEHAHLPTAAHAQRWSNAVLRSLGQQLGRGSKKAVARALPDPLASSLRQVFWLVHFRNKNMTALEFQNQVARRAGNSDKQFARKPILAVFGAMRQWIDGDLDRQVTEKLPPEIRDLWKQAI